MEVSRSKESIVLATNRLATAFKERILWISLHGTRKRSQLCYRFLLVALWMIQQDNDGRWAQLLSTHDLIVAFIPAGIRASSHMGPFGKFTSKLKGQQKESLKNGKHGSDLEVDVQEQYPILSNCGSTPDGNSGRLVHAGHCLSTKGLHDEAAEKTNFEKMQSTYQKDSELHPNQLFSTFAIPDQRGAEVAKSKGSWRDGTYNLNVQKPSEALGCISSPKAQNAGRLEHRVENNFNVSAEIQNPEAMHDSADLDSSSLSLSLGLNRIKTRSGPLYNDGTDAECEAFISGSKSLRGTRVIAKTTKERSEEPFYHRSQPEGMVPGVIDKNKLESFAGNWESDAGRISKGVAHCDVPKISQGKSRRKAKADSQRAQSSYSGQTPSGQSIIPTFGKAFTAGNFGAPIASEKGILSAGSLFAHASPKVNLKSDDILDKKVPSSLFSYLSSELDENSDLEVVAKQLDVIKEGESPPFNQPVPSTQTRIFKNWPKDIKSFSHELGPRGGRSHDVHRPHSDNDLEAILAHLRARFNTAKEEVDAELKFFAADLIEILDQNTDSFPGWKESVEDILVIAQNCTELSPVEFRQDCENIVHDLDERRQELPKGLLKQLYTRMLFILTRCTRLLQFQKETSPEEEGLHKVQQCLKGVPSVERTLPSGSSKRGKGTAISKKLLPEVLEQSARSDAGLPKLKNTRRNRLALDRHKLKNQKSASPKVSQFESNYPLSLKNTSAAIERSELSDSGLSAKVVRKVSDENISAEVEGARDQAEGRLPDVDSQTTSLSSPSKQSNKAPWASSREAEKDESELVICRICEEEVVTSHLEPHSLRCTWADACDGPGVNLDERLRMLADNLEKIAELSTPRSNNMVIDDSLDSLKPLKLNSHDGCDNASPRCSDFLGKVMDGRIDDMCAGETVSVEDLRGLSLINFKRLLGIKADQGVASSSAGSGTPRSTLTTPRTSQLDLLWAERNSFVEQEDTSQIYELAALAQEIAGKSFTDEGVLETLGSCLQELNEILARNKIADLTVDTFGKRIEKLLKEKMYLFNGTGDVRKYDSMSGSYEDDGMSTDDGVQSYRSTPTHPSYNDRITIEDFDMLKLISRGAFGRVFLAKKRATGDNFAIKVLQKVDMIRKNAVENILAERDILITVRNPFVVRFFYSFTCRDNLYLVMEYLIGGDLYSLLRKMGCLEEHAARVYIAELVLALEYLHSLGVVHRDLKPDNILIAHDGHIKLTDFGLSRVGLIDSTDDLSGPTNGNVLMEDSMFETCLDHGMQREYRKERSAVGTPDYLAPEILLGTEHGYTADWWSVGVILFEFITGLPPFNAEHPQIIFDNILNRKIPWPCVPEDMSEDAADLIDKLLTEDPNQRLGAKGAPEVKSHPFFKDISWDNLARQKAAFVPSPESVDDTSYFTSRHHEMYANSSPRFGDSSDCSTSCSSSNSIKGTLNEGEDEFTELADFQSSSSVQRTFNNFSFKNASQLAYMNYDIISQSGRDGARGHSWNQSA